MKKRMLKRSMAAWMVLILLFIAIAPVALMEGDAANAPAVEETTENGTSSVEETELLLDETEKMVDNVTGEVAPAVEEPAAIEEPVVEEPVVEEPVVEEPVVGEPVVEEPVVEEPVVEEPVVEEPVVEEEPAETFEEPAAEEEPQEEQPKKKEKRGFFGLFNRHS